MITYLKHSEIDKEKWDQCISRSVNRLIYAFSWYLDIVSSDWDALVEDDYQSVMPLTHGKKFGIPYLYQPFFAQQLGVFSVNLLTIDLVTRFIHHIPSRFRFIEIALNSFNKLDPFFRLSTTRINHELSLVSPYEQIYQRYTQNAKRNLKKARDAGLTIHRKIDPDELITLFKSNYGKKENRLTYHTYLTIHRLIIASLNRSCAMLPGVYGQRNTLDAAAFFIKDSDRAIMLFAASNYQTRDNGAMFFLIDTFIREHSGRLLVLDFEGGNEENTARFYKNFNASESVYPMLRIDRLPVILQKTVRVIKHIR